MTIDRLAVHALLAEYGALLDFGRYDEWLGLFADPCTYCVIPRENYDAGLPVALVLCDSRAMLEDRIQALREANKYNIHSDRHIIGLPRIVAEHAGGRAGGHAGGQAGEIVIEAPFAVYQTDQEGETRLFVTGLYRDRLEWAGDALRIADKLVLLDTSAVPTLLATPL